MTALHQEGQAAAAVVVVVVYVLSYCAFFCVRLPQRNGVGEGDSRVETDKNSCDRNEECSVLKGLASTPEVCFHSLVREQRS